MLIVYNSAGGSRKLTDAEKLAVLWEERAVTQVMLKFGRTLDTGDWAGQRSCLADVVSMDFERLTGAPEVQVSAEDWVRFADRILSPVRRHHSLVNFQIELDGHRAFAIVYHVSRHFKATDLGQSSNRQIGWYHVWFERRGVDWKIARLKHDFEWIEGNNALFDMNEPTLVEAMGKVFNEDTFSAARAAAAAA